MYICTGAKEKGGIYILQNNKSSEVNKRKKKHQTSFMQNYLDNKQKQKKKNPNRIVYLQIVENVFYYCCMRFDLHMCVQIKKKCQHKCANYDQSKQL